MEKSWNCVFEFLLEPWYSDCSKVVHTFLFFLHLELWLLVHSMLYKIANIGDPDQTALKEQSDLGLHCLPWTHCQMLNVGNF